jgi:signal transduction histidine kinase
LGAVLEQAKGLTESETAALYLYRREDQPALYREAADNSSEAAALRRAVQEDPRARHGLITSGEPLLPTELIHLSSRVASEIKGFASLYAASIPAQRGSPGFVVVATRRPEGFSAYHVEALQAFLQRAALAIQNAQLFEQLQAQVEELRSVHNQVVRAERLAVLGEVAAKVAHEINNPLTSIHLYNSMLLEEPVDAEEQRNIATSILEQVERAKGVVRDVLDYSRQQPPRLEVTNLNATVEQGLRLVRHAAAAAHVTIVEDYAGNLPPIRVDASQMVQVYTNVTLNAIQAMEQDGKLIVNTGMEHDELYVRFEDTGCGIPKDQLERIFEPFVTSKAATEGTGLGLAVCRSLVVRHHGRITVESEVGKGSIFTVWLPPAQLKEGMIARPGSG